MKFIQSDFGEVILNINGGEHYLAEVVKETKEEWNIRCEEYCSLQDVCHQTCSGRRFCRCFDSEKRTECCFVTEEPLNNNDYE